MPANTKHINYLAMVEQFAGDTELFNRFASKYINNYLDHLAKIDEAFKRSEPAALKTCIHGYKNLLCNFHAEKVYKKFVEMEKLVDSGLLDSAKKLYEEVRSASAEIAAEIKEIKNLPIR